MCGILGMAGDYEADVRQAAGLMGHRGPDATAVWSDGTVTLGHNRLSVIDLDARSNQPFFDDAEEIGIAFNGEIYNYRELKQQLLATGKYAFRTESDTEVLVYAYKEWGESFVERLTGMYALALFDRPRAHVLLFTDQAAIKPLFYRASGGSFLFASELKSITSMMRSSDIALRIDEEGLDLYWALGYVPAPRTLFAEVRRMPPRSLVRYDLHTKECTVTEYGLPGSPPLALDEFRELVERKVASHLVADVPVGLFFSGGTDSSLIASILARTGTSLDAFCVELENRPEDARYAESIAQELGMTLHRSRFGPREFESVYDELVEKIDEPISDSSIFPTYFVAKEAAKKVRVVLSGEGGDEFFFGYPRSRILHRLREAPLDVRTGFLERLFFVLPHFKGKNKAFEYTYAALKRPLAYYLLTMSPTKDLMTLEQWKSAKAAAGRIVRGTRFLDADLYLPHVLLRKTDMATMYCSIEGRVPLLDREIIAAAIATPQQVTSSGPLKPLLKRILTEYLPHRLTYRKKTGFGIRTNGLFQASERLRSELDAAIRYLQARDLLLVPIPSEQRLLTSYSGLVWQILMLYHACRSARI